MTQNPAHLPTFPSTVRMLAAYATGTAVPPMVATLGYWEQGYVDTVDAGTATNPAFFYYYNASDTTTPDNGGTIRVDVGGHRWYLMMDKEINLRAFGLIADRTSHPLSTKFGTLAAAQAVYACASALTDEIDWCAWQSAINWVYTRDLTSQSLNWSCGHYVADGWSIVNRTIELYNDAALVRGINPLQATLGGAVAIEYNGPAGTVDQPIYIFDCYTTKEDGSPPAGKFGNDIVFPKFIFENISFTGKAGSMFGSPSASAFVSAIRIRQANFVQINNCVFRATLWDGIKFTGAQLFTIVERNFFAGVFRDAVAFDRVQGNFSTTMWMRNNEYNFVNRYQTIMDLSGSVEPKPVVWSESYEGGSNGTFFAGNQNWWVCGIESPTCFLSCGNIVFDANRFEGQTDTVTGYWADVALTGTTNAAITNSTLRNLFLFTRSQAQQMTVAAEAYLLANYHLDITDTRNYNLGTAADFSPENEQLILHNNFNLNKLLVADELGLGVSARHTFSQVTLIFLNVLSASGTYITLVEPRTSALVELLPLPSTVVFTTATMLTSESLRTFGNFNTQTMIGDYLLQSGGYGTWAALTAYSATVQLVNITSSFVQPTVQNGFAYQAVTSGTTAAGEPVWPTTIGVSVVDGTVTWLCVATMATLADVASGMPEWMENGARRRRLAAIPPAVWTPPSAAGDAVYITVPISGQFIGSVCTAGGSPGTWKNWGAIA